MNSLIYRRKLMYLRSPSFEHPHIMYIMQIYTRHHHHYPLVGLNIV